MKAQILKIAGVKSEKEFYKKYPSEEAFMKVHGKEFKKAQWGAGVDTSAGTTYPSLKNYSFGNQQVPANEINYQFNSMPFGNQDPFNNIKFNSETSQFDYADPYKKMVTDNLKVPELTFGNPQGDQANTKMAKGIFEGAHSVEKSPFSSSKMPGAGQILGSATGIIDAAGAFKEQKKKLQGLKQQRGVADVSLQAAQSTDVDARRQMQDTFSKQRNAMMQPMTGENLFPVNGVGTNVLARNGRMLQGGGEIQNTFAPNDIYTDSGYEPLSDSEIVKQYYNGGGIPQAQNGFSNFMGAGGTDFANKAVMGAFGNNAGSQMGTAVGGALKMIPGVGPVLGAVAAPVLGAIGGGLDQAFGDAGKIKKEQAGLDRSMMGLQNVSATKDLQRQNQSYMEDGGWVSNDWQPQVITSFGGLDEQEVYDYAHEGMDTLRAGGHLREYTPPSNRAMETYKNGGDVQSYGLGGELQTHWGGGAETISRNPYLPGTGETVMFRGKSHEEYSPNGETGIGVTYGGNPVEVERGEPMVELEEGGVVDPMTGEVQKSGVVFGNLKIPNQYIDMLGDKNAKGKKFKNYVNDLSKIESKQNTLIEKSTKELDGLTPRNSFDKLKLTALQASIQGANMKLKDIADKKINAASLQNAINDTAEENGLVADDLARGKVKIDKEAQKEYAKFGGKFTKAQDGIYSVKGNLPGSINYNPIGSKSGGDLWKDETTYNNVWKPKVYSAFSDPRRAEELIKKLEAYSGDDAADVQAAIKKGKTPEEKKAIAIDLATDKMVGPFHSIMDSVINETLPAAPEQQEGVQTGVDWTSKTPTAQVEEEEKSKFPWQAYANQALQYLRPTDQEGLDASQLYPEMYAMSTNQLEPVQANFYRPELGVPYDISLQDQLNANQADYRAAQRMMGYNPAAQANLNAQKYQANQGILGDQFRANQAMKDRVYGENRNILNDAKLKNLGIADQQYTRQAEAMSNTKATTQAALNSIADKYAKNKLENRTLSIYENMYNYRFGKSGRAQNYNPLQFFDTTIGGAKSRKNEGDIPGLEATRWDKNGNPIAWKKSSDKDTTDDYDYTELDAAGKTPGIADKRNGGSVKNNKKNSSIVRAFKNL